MYSLLNLILSLLSFFHSNPKKSNEPNPGWDRVETSVPAVQKTKRGKVIPPRRHRIQTTENWLKLALNSR